MLRPGEQVLTPPVFTGTFRATKSCVTLIVLLFREHLAPFMKVNQAKQIVSKAIEQLSQALERGHSETLKKLPRCDWSISSVQSAKRNPYRIAETNGYARRWLSYLAQTWTFREDRRERDFDFCSGWLGREVSLPQPQLPEVVLLLTRQACYFGQ